MAPKTKAPIDGYKAAPPSLSYEFGGPIGALGVTLAVPFFSYWLAFACTEDACPRWPLPELLDWHAKGASAIFAGDRTWWSGMWSWEATAVYFGWYAWTVLCWAALPGKEVQGTVMRDGNTLTYRMNGESGRISFGMRRDQEADLTLAQHLRPSWRRCLSSRARPRLSGSVRFSTSPSTGRSSSRRVSS